MNIASLLQGFASIVWLLLIALVVLSIVRAAQNRPLRKAGSMILVTAVVAVVSSLIAAGLVFIEPQERGVVISAISPKGYRDQALEPGLRWVIPFAEYVVRYPISNQTYTMSKVASEGDIVGDDSIAARTADGQEIFVDASVIFAVDPDKVVQVHIKWQDRYAQDLVRPLARGVVRDAVSQYGVEEVVSGKRFELVDRIRTTLAQKLEENGLVLVDFVLRNVTFSPEYAASVEQKQIAEQQAQQARFIVEQKKQEAEQARQVAQGKADAAVIEAKGQAEARIIQAKAEAEALKVIAEALREDPELLNYLYITKLSPNIQALLLPSNAPFILPLPTQTTPSPQPQVTPTP